MRITEKMRVIIFDSKSEYKKERTKLGCDGWSELDEDYCSYSDGAIQSTFFRHPEFNK